MVTKTSESSVSNPGSKWTVTSSNLLTTGASQVFALSNTAEGALFEMGRAGIVSTPYFDVRSGGLSNDYDVRFEFSGGNSANGNGLMDIKSSSVTINSNTVWHAGNDGVNSQLDAHYVDGYTQNSSNVANTLVRRTGSGDIFISDVYADQGVFSNNGTSILSLGDGNGVNLGKATTNVLSVKGKIVQVKVILDLVMMVTHSVTMVLTYHTIMYTSEMDV